MAMAFSNAGNVIAWGRRVLSRIYVTRQIGRAGGTVGRRERTRNIRLVGGDVYVGKAAKDFVPIAGTGTVAVGVGIERIGVVSIHFRADANTGQSSITHTGATSNPRLIFIFPRQALHISR